MIKTMKKILALLLMFGLVGSPIITMADQVLATDQEMKSTVISDELNIAMQEALNTDSQEKISVCIWYEDIENETLEREVEETIGVTYEALDTEINAPSGELLALLYNAESLTENEASSLNSKMREYLESTKEARAQERELSQAYISSKISICEDYFSIKSQETIEALQLSSSSIEYVSRYSPMLIANLTYDEIEWLEQQEEVQFLDLCTEIDEDLELPWNSISGMKEINGYNDTFAKTGLTGEGVSVGVIDHGAPVPYSGDDYDATKIQFVGGTAILKDHPQNTVNIIFGNDGLSPNIDKIYAASLEDPSYDEDYSFYLGIEDLTEAGVTLINASINQGYRTNGAYCDKEKWLDYMINKYNLTFVQSAGNGGADLNSVSNTIWQPGGAYNAITVGAMDDHNTSDKSDDTVFYYSSYDPSEKLIKPDFIAPGNLAGGGTSSSAPVVTAIIAQMIELKPSLSVHPQAIKAILMASCHRKGKDPVSDELEETMTDGLTKKQGAGIIDPYIAFAIVGNKQYGERVLDSTTDVIHVIQPRYQNSSINYSVAWFNENLELNSSGANNGFNTINNNIQNLDLKIYDGDNTLLGQSINENSSTEMAYIGLSSLVNKHQIRVTKTNYSNRSPKYAYAWSTNKNLYQIPSDNGLYLIQNVSNKKFLGVDNSGGIVQKNYTGEDSQRWIITNNYSGSLYYLKNGSIQSSVLKRGATLDANSAYAVMEQNANKNIQIFEYEDDTYGIKTQRLNTSFWDSLQPLNQLGTENNSIIFYTTNASEAQKWHLMRLSYRLGDVDMNGILDATDASYILQQASQQISFDSSQSYLADVDCDGRITSEDALIVLKIASGQLE